MQWKLGETLIITRIRSANHSEQKTDGCSVANVSLISRNCFPISPMHIYIFSEPVRIFIMTIRPHLASMTYCLLCIHGAASRFLPRTSPVYTANPDMPWKHRSLAPLDLIQIHLCFPDPLLCSSYFLLILLTIKIVIGKIPVKFPEIILLLRPVQNSKINSAKQSTFTITIVPHLFQYMIKKI